MYARTAAVNKIELMMGIPESKRNQIRLHSFFPHLIKIFYDLAAFFHHNLDMK